MEKVCIYIDLYNFLNYSYRYLGKRAYIDFVKIHNYFIDKNECLSKVKIYGGSNMSGLLYKLSYYDHIEIIEELSGWDNKDKTTDVNIAIDMLVDAFNNNYDKAILISGDADFIRAIIEVQNLNKTVFIATTENEGVKNARKLIEYADGLYVLDMDFFRKYQLKIR